MEQGWEGKGCMPASLWVGVGNSADGPSTTWAQPPGLCGSRLPWVRPEGHCRGSCPLSDELPEHLRSFKTTKGKKKKKKTHPPRRNSISIWVRDPGMGCFSVSLVI